MLILTYPSCISGHLENISNNLLITAIYSENEEMNSVKNQDTGKFERLQEFLVSPDSIRKLESIGSSLEMTSMEAELSMSSHMTVFLRNQRDQPKGARNVASDFQQQGQLRKGQTR